MYVLSFCVVVVVVCLSFLFAAQDTRAYIEGGFPVLIPTFFSQNAKYKSSLQQLCQQPEFLEVRFGLLATVTIFNFLL